MNHLKSFFLIILILALFTLSQPTVQYFPNLIWVYWNNGVESLGQMGKLCIQKIVEINKDWEIKLVSDKSLREYLDQNQLKQLQEIMKFQGVQITPLQKSYFVRLMLLRRYGGVYVDALTIPLEDFSWIFKLEANLEVMNKLGQSPQAFLFYEAYDPALGRLNIVRQDNLEFYPTIQIDLTLLASMKQSNYIKDLFNQLKTIHQKGEDYYKKVSEELFLFREFKESQTLKLANHIIQHRQYREFEANKKQKLPFSIYNFYKVWAINRMKGPYSYSRERNIQILFKDVRHFIYQPKYLIKLQANKRDSQLNKFLRNDSFQKDMSMRQYNQYLFDFGEYYLPNSYSCLYKSYIDQNSIMNKNFIQEFNNKKQLSIQTLEVKKNKQIPWICKKTTLYNLYDHFMQIWKFLYIPFYLIVFIQFLVEITLGLKRYNIELRENNLCQQNKEEVKEKIYLVGLLAYVVYLQYCFLYEEIFMWYYESPSSFVLWIFNLAIMCFVLSYFNIVERKLFRTVIKMKHFIGLLIVLLFIQQLVVQWLAVWNYKGFLFHFEKLSRMNIVNNNEIFWGFLKIIIMFMISQIYYGLKKYHNKNGNQIYQKLRKFLGPAINYMKLKYGYLLLKIGNIKKNIIMEPSSQEESSKILSE